MACSTGSHHTLTLSEDGTVFCFGHNGHGQLGIHSEDEFMMDSQKDLPFPLLSLPKIKMISCGECFSVCVCFEGNIWSFGENHYGQLGVGNNNNSMKPVRIEGIPSVSSISCGGEHLLFITASDQHLWSVGRGDYGQLCLENQINYSTPKQTSHSNILNISAGGNHSLFQNSEGEIYSCGYNSFGQLGLGHNFATQIGACLIPNQPPNIIQFCCGSNHSLFLDVEGNVFSVGKNVQHLYDTCSGQLGLGHNENQNILNQIPNILSIQTISCVSSSSYLLDFDGNVWSFGDNRSGQLGHGDETNRNVPTKITALRDITEISYSFGEHFLAKNSTGEIFIMGRNRFGQLGSLSYDSGSLPEKMQKGFFTIWKDARIKSKAKSARK